MIFMVFFRGNFRWYGIEIALRGLSMSPTRRVRSVRVARSRGETRRVSRVCVPCNKNNAGGDASCICLCCAPQIQEEAIIPQKGETPPCAQH